MAKKPDLPDAGIGSALDSCSWDYTAPQPPRRFFLNPMSSFFGDFPWEGLVNRAPATPGPDEPTAPVADGKSSDPTD